MTPTRRDLFRMAASVGVAAVVGSPAETHDSLDLYRVVGGARVTSVFPHTEHHRFIVCSFRLAPDGVGYVAESRRVWPVDPGIGGRLPVATALPRPPTRAEVERFHDTCCAVDAGTV